MDKIDGPTDNLFTKYLMKVKEHKQEDIKNQ